MITIYTPLLLLYSFTPSRVSLAKTAAIKANLEIEKTRTSIRFLTTALSLQNFRHLISSYHQLTIFLQVYQIALILPQVIQ